MDLNKFVVILREDYKFLDYLIDLINFIIDIYDDYMKVMFILDVKLNGMVDKLFLLVFDGEGLEFKLVLFDYEELKEG